MLLLIYLYSQLYYFFDNLFSSLIFLVIMFPLFSLSSYAAMHGLHNLSNIAYWHVNPKLHPNGPNKETVMHHVRVNIDCFYTFFYTRSSQDNSEIFTCSCFPLLTPIHIYGIFIFPVMILHPGSHS